MQFRAGMDHSPENADRAGANPNIILPQYCQSLHVNLRPHNKMRDSVRLVRRFGEA